MHRPCLFKGENLESIVTSLHRSLLQIGVARGSVFK